MKIYAESSAVLAWLLGEDAAPAVRQILTRAELVIASDLTLIECGRVLIPALTLGEIDEGRQGRSPRSPECGGSTLARPQTEYGSC